MAKNRLKFRCPHCRARLTTISSKPNIVCPKCTKAVNLAEMAAVAAANAKASHQREIVKQDSGSALATAKTPRRHGWVPFIIIGILFACLLSVALDALRDTLGLQGFVYAIASLLGFAVIASIARGFMQSRVSADAGSHVYRWFIPNLRWTSLVATAAFVMMFPIFVLESLGPNLGYIKGQAAQQLAQKNAIDEEVSKANEVEMQRQKEATEAKQKAERKKLLSEFAKSNFILANPTHYLVGVKEERVNTNPVYRVIALADGTDSRDIVNDVLAEAWDSRIPVVAERPQIARRVYDASRPGEVVKSELHQTIRDIVRPPTILPKASEYVSFVDATSRKQRFAQVVRDAEQELVVCDLVPMKKIIVSPSTEDDPRPEDVWECENIKLNSTTVTRNILEHQLRTLTDTESAFLDYCVLKILQTLETQTDDPNLFAIRPSVHVDDVSLSAMLENQLHLDLEQSLAAAKSDYVFEVKQQLMNLHTGSVRPPSFMEEIRYTLGFLKNEMDDKRTALIDEQKAKFNSELLTRFQTEIDDVKAKIDKYERVSNNAVHLQQELLSLLGRAGVVIVDRSEKARRAYAKRNGEIWIRASADDAVEDGLVQATHLLLPEISAPEKDGTYRMHMRLVDVRTGTILWNDNGKCQNASIAQNDAYPFGQRAVFAHK